MAADHPTEFEEFFRKLWPDARRVATRIVRDGDEADDVVAEAFARALVRWRTVGTLNHREAWLLRTVTNCAIDVVRRRRTLSVAVEHAEDPADNAVLRLALAAALEQLPRRQRQVVTLRYLAGWPADRVAESLGVTLNTVKKHNDRAVAALRRSADTTLEGFGAH